MAGKAKAAAKPKVTAGQAAATATASEAAMPLKGDSAWFVRDRFGMFIHWGTYAAGARHEWLKRNERMTDERYQTYFEHFDPDLFDPEAWARAARIAGMKYMVITAKHHEGFCLWDSRHTDYKAPNTPARRDLLHPVVDAFRAEGLRIGLYYSLLDWHHPDYPLDRCHPMWENEEFKAKAKGRDIRKYQKYMRDQVTELLTEFGKIDYLFFDFSFANPDGKGRDDWDSPALMKLCRTLQPQILLDNRLDLTDVPGGWDVMTPEEQMASAWPTYNGKKALWETCQTLCGSWGYHRQPGYWKTVTQNVFLLIDTVSKGGNLLLNVGPTARGEFNAPALASLSGIGEWMRQHGRSIYGCTQAPDDIPTPQDARLTWNPETKRLYVHILNWPLGTFALPGMAGRVKYAQLLHDAGEVTQVDAEQHAALAWMGPDHKAKRGTVLLKLPMQKPDVAVPVVELFLE